MEQSPAWGYWGFGRTNEKLIRSQGCRERAGWGYTPAPPFPCSPLPLLPPSPAPPFPRQNLGLSYLTCPPKREGAGTDPKTGPTTPYSLLPRPGQDAAGLSRRAPGEQDGGRSSVGTQKGQRPQRSPLGEGIECRSQRGLEVGSQFLERRADEGALLGFWRARVWLRNAVPLV